MAVIDEYLGPALMGEDPFNIEHLVWKMERAAVENPFSKAALEMALLDLIGKKLQVPVYQLLGGQCRSERIPIKFVVAATEPEIAIRNAEQMVGRGFTMIKVKVGTDPKADVQRVQQVWEALGSAVRLSVDANGG